MMKKIKCILIVALAVMLMLASLACGRQEASSILPDDYVPEISGKLTVMARSDVYTSEASRRGIKNWVNEFTNTYSDVNIDVQFVDNSQYQPMISSKSMGDVFFLDDGSLYQYAITSKALMALDYFVEALHIDISTIYTGIYDLGVCEGKLYMAGMSCGQQSFTYNKTMLYENGILEQGERIENDWTWEDFKAISEQLKKFDENDGETQVQIGASMPLYWSPYFSSFFGAYGGKWCDTENKKIHLHDDPLVLKGIEELINAVDNGYIYPIGTTLGSEMAKRLSGINTNNRASGGVCFSHQTSYSMLTDSASQYLSSNVDWDVAPYFLFDYKASPCGTLGFGVYSFTRNRDAAAALVLSLYTVEGQLAIHGQQGGDVPVIKELGDQDFWHLTAEGYEDKNYEAFTANYDRYIKSHVKAQVPPEIAEIVESSMSELWSKYCQGQADWDDLIRRIEEKCNQKWDSLNWKEN